MPMHFDKGLGYVDKAKQEIFKKHKNNNSCILLHYLRLLMRLKQIFENSVKLPMIPCLELFPLTRFLPLACFMEATAAGTFELFDDISVMASTGAAESLIEAIAIGFKGSPQFTVIFNSTPKDHALENEVLYMFNQLPKYYVKSRFDVIGALRSKAPNADEVESALKVLDSGGEIPIALREVFFDEFATKWLLLVTVEQYPSDHD